MVLEKISNAISNSLKKITNSIFVDKKLVDSVIKELQRALIESDVDVGLVLDLTKKIKEISLKENIKDIDKKEQIIALLHEKLKEIVGEGRQIKIDKKTKILFLGLYGSGKTTTIAKVGFYFSKRGKKVCALGLDTQRAAAMDQLEQMCEKAKIECFVDKEEKEPTNIIKKYKEKLENFDLVLIDSAGRDALNEELIKEIKKIDKLIKPDYRILVISADIGQAAKKQAEEFQKALSIDGVIITKMDGTAKAGGALTACAQTKAPIFFIGTGEKIYDIEVFDSESFISRILGMGDLKTLIDKVHSAIDEKQQKRIEEKLKEGKLTLEDFYEQIDSMNQIGSFDKLLSLIPGFSSASDKISKEELEKQQEKIKRWKYAIQSMTKEERENPDLLEKQTTRIQRISKGSGVTTSEIKEMLKQYKIMRDLIKSQSSLEGFEEGKINKKLMMRIAKKFKGKFKF
ncbi:MAG: signal recognition particle receptor subunit alpha [Candidatus Pacearchaeota archaeon]